MSQTMDPVVLARELIRRPSITPADAGALDVLQEALEPLGFTCHRLRFEEPGFAPVDNLYARRGSAGPNLCFAGHTDVVPPGDVAAWRCDPFAARLEDGVLVGRGAVDMKGAIACFVAAVARFLGGAEGFAGSLSLLVTGDEEGAAVNGTRKLLDWLRARGERLDACLVGEPTSSARVGDVVKIGRRGSLNATVVVHGQQGHVAYPQLADNPLHRAVSVLGSLIEEPLDEGTAHFAPSRLQLTSIDTGNPAVNVIPARVEVRLNVRYNDRHDAASLERWLRSRLDASGARYELRLQASGDAFLTPPGPFTEVIAAAVQSVTGAPPELSTSGGTSDARFIKDLCPVVELGLVNATMHKVDEAVSLADLEALTRMYEAVLQRYFPAPLVSGALS